MVFNTEESTLQFLEENIYDDNFTGKSDEEKTTLRGQLKKKLGVAIELLPSDVKQRRRRLQMATDACLEDVDVEVVRERRDKCSGRDVAHPFLRLRVRYTDAQGGDVSRISLPGRGEIVRRLSRVFHLNVTSWISMSFCFD